MRHLTNEILQALIDHRFEGDTSPSELLLPIQEVLQSARLSLSDYAIALIQTGLTGTAFLHLDDLETTEGLAPELIARASLLRLDLEAFSGMIPSDDITQRKKRCLTTFYSLLPQYQPSFAGMRSEIRPVRVEVTSPLRLDLGMGGISDLPPRMNEQPGRAVSFCVNINRAPPIRCVAEVTGELGIQLESVGYGPLETISTWDELADTTAPTILRSCLEHLFSSVKRNQELSDFIMSLLGGGLQIRTLTTAPKGLGSSSVVASVVLQAMLRLLGQAIDWQDLVHRTVTVEHMIGTGGGWEDALPAFVGSVVLAESVPSRLPIVNAKRLTISPQVVKILEERLVLFDTEQKGYTGEVLTQGLLRYLSGDPAALKACDVLYDIAGRVADAIEMGNIEDLGTLLTEQWKEWKIVTEGLCTTDYIESVLAGAEPWIDGAKVNGAGSGGAVLFIAKDGKLNQLLKYLQSLKGSVISWQPDMDGYRVQEWYNPARVASFVKKSFQNLFQVRSSYDRHGEVVRCHIEEFSNEHNEISLVGPLNPAILDLMPDLSLSIFGVAAALVDRIGTGTKETFDSTKKLIDAVASAVFSEEMGHWQRQASVVTAEGKDEYGEPQPTVKTELPSLPERMELRVAVDVVDGTTLVALGQPSAYSIGVIGEGLHSFPDLQAYAILAPTSTFGDLDLVSPPELAVEHNLRVIARSLGKRVNELVILTQGEDTGRHHRGLIQAMQTQGVSVVVPDRVMVESPYVVAACTEHSLGVDGMIGVFGLPEIAINTILCGVLNRGKGIIFRLVGNAPLKSREQTTLDNVLDLTSEEAAIATAHGLRTDKLYTFANIASGPACIFAGAAITDDPILGIRGVAIDSSCVAVEGLLADPCGNLYKLCIDFRRPSLIDYSARYSLPLFDISLVIELDTVERGVATVKRIEQLTTQIGHLLPGAYTQPCHQTTAGEPGLHITIYEFAADYFPSINPEAQQEVFRVAVATIATALKKELRGVPTVTIGAARRTSNGIIIDVTLDSQLEEAIDRINKDIAGSGISNVPPVRIRHHTTIARFTEVLTEEMLIELDQLLDSFNEFSGESLLVRRLLLKRAMRTPFRDIQQSTTICLAG